VREEGEASEEVTKCDNKLLCAALLIPWTREPPDWGAASLVGCPADELGNTMGLLLMSAAEDSCKRRRSSLLDGVDMVVAYSIDGAVVLI
jgi:hypothetical protein